MDLYLRKSCRLTKGVKCGMVEWVNHTSPRLLGHMMKMQKCEFANCTSQTERWGLTRGLIGRVKVRLEVYTKAAHGLSAQLHCIGP